MQWRIDGDINIIYTDFGHIYQWGYQNFWKFLVDCISLIVTLISGEVNLFGQYSLKMARSAKFSLGMCFLPMGTNLGHLSLPVALVRVFFQRVGIPADL